MTLNLLRILSILALAFLAVPLGAGAADFSFARHTINAQSAFETCGVGDINRDGRLDVMCGDTWYEATGNAAEPWKRHRVCTIKEQDGYYHDFANELEDVNGDGRLDVVSCTWHTKEVLWREQPVSLDQQWPTHVVDTPGNMEVGFHVDINRDGLPDFHPHVKDQVVWYERLKKPVNGSYWKRHDVGKRVGFGEGTGDIDGDGDLDIVVSRGWFEHPNDSDAPKWKWHGEFNLGDAASDPVLVHDFTGDGRADIVWGMAHDYGLFWLEQGRDAQGGRTWKRFTIDTSWSQPHFMALADLNGDGVPDVVTGKRYHAHNGRDPGGNDPLIVCVYAWNAKARKFTRHVLDHDGRIGFGLRSVVKDLEGDGDLDIVCPGKSGLYWLENRLR